MSKKICSILVFFISFIVFCLNVNATTYKCTYEFSVSNNLGSSTKKEGYFEVDTVAKKINPQTKVIDWGNGKTNNVIMLDPIVDNNYDEVQTVNKLDGNCPDKVYACIAVGQHIISTTQVFWSYTTLLLNASLMDEIKFYDSTKHTYSIGTNEIIYIKNDEEYCSTGAYIEDKSTAPSKHVEFECTNFTNLWDEYDSKYCDSSLPDCNVSRVTEYKEAKNKLKEYCRNKLQYSNTFDPCVSECLKLSERISEKEGTTSTNSQCGFSGKLIIFIANIVKWGKYLIPVIVIVLSILDFIKAISSEKEDEMKKAQGNFVKRLIIAGLIFIIPFIIEFVLDKMGFGKYISGCGIIDL